MHLLVKGISIDDRVLSYLVEWKRTKKSTYSREIIMCTTRLRASDFWELGGTRKVFG